MLWDGFLELASQGTPDVPPGIVLIHLSGNDLTQRGDKLLIIAGHCGPAGFCGALSWKMQIVVCNHIEPEKEQIKRLEGP